MNRVPKVVPCKPTQRPPCRRDDEDELATYAEVVAAYIRHYRPGASRLLRFFQNCETLVRAIEYAARCKLPSGKRHPHQYRIPKKVLAEAERRLLKSAAELRGCQTFAELHELVRGRIGGIMGIGALTVYDVAHHLGAHLGLEPEAVYLHAGTARGARALGLDHTAESLQMAELPAAFRRLRPDEAEDCLCLYQEELEAIDAESSAAPDPGRRGGVQAAAVHVTRRT
jgi:hypothetical protein